MFNSEEQMEKLICPYLTTVKNNSIQPYCCITKNCIAFFISTDYYWEHGTRKTKPIYGCRRMVNYDKNC